MATVSVALARPILFRGYFRVRAEESAARPRTRRRNGGPTDTPCQERQNVRHRLTSPQGEPDCIVCGIVAGEIPSTTIAQTNRAIAFMDINPATPGHALVIPRSHATDLLDITADDLAACSLLAQQVARRAKDRLGADGVNLLNCTGEAAWQTVFHFHLHLVLRFKDEPGKDRIGLPRDTVPTNLDEIERIGNLLS